MTTPLKHIQSDCTDAELSAADFLISEGWTEGRDQFRQYARMFWKRHATPTRCACNDDKDGMQVCVYVSEFQGRESHEIELCGELPDGTWIKLHQWSMPSDIRSGLAKIGRLLSTWEFIAHAQTVQDAAGNGRAK